MANFYKIVYTAIVGVVMLAAVLEWFLWIGAFMYCLWKVFRKSEHWTVNVLAVIIAVAFLLLRYVILYLRRHMQSLQWTD